MSEKKIDESFCLSEDEICLIDSVVNNFIHRVLDIEECAEQFIPFGKSRGTDHGFKKIKGLEPN